MEFSLDRFQAEAIEAIDRGESVLVAAPTGAGKTVIAEHAMTAAIESGTRAFYTTPIKALSNQKYHDLVAQHGDDNVGLLTGDRAISPHAPLVVMTTEVLRNMLYGRSAALKDLRWVVLDEVHYLRDRSRGPVWEEVIIHSPPEVKLVALSATVSNLDEFADWLRSVRGETTLVSETKRPVKLEHFQMVDLRGPVLIPLTVDGEVNDEGHRWDAKRGERNRSSKHTKPRTPWRGPVVRELEAQDLLPAIYFLFSRAGCSEAAEMVASSRPGLIGRSEQAEIKRRAQRHVGHLSQSELKVLGWDEFSSALNEGIAAHHAGLVPAFKELVEECFLEGLVKVVFATETLALGINMPARTVVLEKLTKFNGQTHEQLTPLEYTQLTGRAGRRGLDTSGTAIALWSPWIRFAELAALATSTEYPLISAFRPSYNMAANLIANFDSGEARALLRQSFGQFQADRGIVHLERRRERLATQAEQLAADAACERGSIAEALADRNKARSNKAGKIRGAVSVLRPGDVIGGNSFGSSGTFAVVSVAHRRNGSIRVRMVDMRGSEVVRSLDEFFSAPAPITNIELPTPFDPASVRFRSAVARTMKRLDAATESGGDDEGRVVDCPRFRDHVDAHYQLKAVNKKLRRAERKLSTNERAIDLKFDQVCAVLVERQAIKDWTLLQKGEMLLKITHESDLLAVEAMAAGLFDDLDAPSLAALVSCITYEPRSDERSPRTRMPSVELRNRIDELDRIYKELHAAEAGLHEPLTRQSDEGLAAMVYGWASGSELSEILDEDTTGGDFVRQIRQLVDLLRQLAEATPNAVTASVARSAAEMLQRGVVAAES